MARPLNPPMRGKGEGYAFLMAHKDDEDGPCVIWPMSHNDTGYGCFGHLGKKHYAHRFMCELANGPPPTPTHEAAHNCGNGQGGCVHPKHLEWKTASENHMDRRRHGTAVTSRCGFYGKIAGPQRDEIRSLAATHTQRQLAAKYGVAFQTISRIIREDPNRARKLRPFSPEEIAKMTRLRMSGESDGNIARLLGRPKVSVWGYFYRRRFRAAS